jgi:hypothetical protein
MSIVDKMETIVIQNSDFLYNFIELLKVYDHRKVYNLSTKKSYLKKDEEHHHQTIFQ